MRHAHLANLHEVKACPLGQAKWFVRRSQLSVREDAQGQNGGWYAVNFSDALVEKITGQRPEPVKVDDWGR